MAMLKNQRVSHGGTPKASIFIKEFPRTKHHKPSIYHPYFRLGFSMIKKSKYWGTPMLFGNPPYEDLTIIGFFFIGK